MDTNPLPTDHLPYVVALEGGSNFRDLGGYRTAEGRTIAQGKVFRSAHLGTLTDRDRAALGRLGVRTVVDSWLVNHSIRPFTTSEKSPRVSRIRGNERIFATGRTKALTNPKTSATPRNGNQSPTYETPETRRVATQSDAALTSSRTMKPADRGRP